MKDIQPKSLEIYLNDDGVPGEKVTGDFSVGAYDISVGKNFTIFLHNGNHNLIADISNWGTENPYSTLVKPDTILPMETVKLTIKVPKRSEQEIESNPQPDDFVDSIGGNTTWERVNVTYDDKERIYGWDQYV